MQYFILLIFFLYGLVFGSFFNVVGLRVPTQSLFTQKRSYCDTCERTLTWRELVPVWSFAVQKGRCRGCSESISPLYPVMELTTGLLFAFTYYLTGFNSELVLGLLLIALIIPVTVSDIVYRRIPNRLLLFFSPFFILYRLISPLDPFWNSLAGAGGAFLLVFLIILISKGGMGIGDLKYYTLFGFVFGLGHFLLLFFLSTLYGALAGGIMMKVKKLGRKTKIPFGPYIGLAALTVFYFGDILIQWYLNLFS
ncbi:leader peptidase (prepilin peptidase) / N-methyltransferase [Alkalibacterium putridalgicola]|uniref:Leader peptidase (Prepilin peptidase) / N-methyltransferase n=1 Tax=Alkalibacterium putridalgicola TaxID=426703 RepID=A0A1H7TAI1_9LACT|nr:A24 family peptidase [Alkalibacterium putridalgicola]GEK89322.1 type 4 prepilin-like proteins leader peptide-processing enzyme [Alkalibacterium putridalgicola]SEL80837.1 leader peptidase (prepilin peptidase) / N-methyltransferase [Alkalibacterium putridalgicola]